MQIENAVARRTSTTIQARSPRRLLVLAAVVAFTLAVLLASAPQALAGWSTSPPAGGGHGGVTDSRFFVYACDDKADSRGIYTQYHWYGATRPWEVWAPGAGSCKQVRSPGRVYNFRVCRTGSWTNFMSCSGWKSV
jgi:hypothetical protein